MPPTRPTIKDIADHLGVSKGTVSLALNDQAGVNEQTRQRIKQYAQQVGYRPNVAAQILGSGRSRMIAVVLARLNDSFFEEIVQGIQDVAGEQGYDVIVGTAWTRGASAMERVHRLIDRRIDGFIGSSSAFPPEARRRLREAGVHQLYLGPEPVEDYPTVIVDNAHGIRLAAEHLYDSGHRQILFLGTHDLHSTIRFQAAHDALTAHGDATLTHRIADGHHDMQLAYHAMATVLRSRRAFTAVLCASDILAVGVCNALLDAGISIPGEVSVVGFDDLRWTRLVRPALTTVHQPQVTQGEVAMRALLDQIEGREAAPGQNLTLLPHLIIRDSTGPAALLGIGKD